MRAPRVPIELSMRSPLPRTTILRCCRAGSRRASEASASAWRYPVDCAAPDARARRNRPAPARRHRRDSSARSPTAGSLPANSASSCGFTDRTGMPSRMVRSSGSAFALLRVSRTCTSTFCPGRQLCQHAARIGHVHRNRAHSRGHARSAALFRRSQPRREHRLALRQRHENRVSRRPAARLRTLRRASARPARASTGRLFRPAPFQPESAWRPPPPSCRCPCCCSVCSRTSRKRRRWR